MSFRKELVAAAFKIKCKKLIVTSYENSKVRVENLETEI